MLASEMKASEHNRKARTYSARVPPISFERVKTKAHRPVS
jgi:hypothetical protein